MQIDLGPPWVSDLIAAQKQLAEQVERLIEEQASRRSTIGALHTLGDGDILLSTPILFSKEEDGEGVSLSVDELGVYVWGETDYEAVSELARQIARLWTDLENAPESELGPALVRTRNVLRSVALAYAENLQHQRR